MQKSLRIISHAVVVVIRKFMKTFNIPKRREHEQGITWLKLVWQQYFKIEEAINTEAVKKK